MARTPFRKTWFSGREVVAVVLGLIVTVALYAEDFEGMKERAGGTISAALLLATGVWFILTAMLWNLIALIMLLLWRPFHKLGKVFGKGYRSATVAFMTQNYSALRDAVTEASLAGVLLTTSAAPTHLKECHYGWRAAVAKSRLLSGLFAFLGLFFLVLPINGLLFTEKMSTEEIVSGLILATGIFFVWRKASANRWYAHALAKSLDWVKSDLGLELDGFDRAEQERVTCPVLAGAMTFPVVLDFSRNGHVVIEVKRSALPSCYKLDPLSADNLAEEEADIDLGDPNWDRHSILKVSEFREGREPAAIWFPKEVRTVVLPLLALGCRIEGGALTIPLPVDKDTASRVVDAISYLKELLPRWESVADTPVIERAFVALGHEGNDSVRRHLLEACRTIDLAEHREHLATRWSKEGKGPTRVTAATLAEKDTKAVQLLIHILGTSPDPDVRAEALVEIFARNFDKATEQLNKLGKEDADEVIYAFSLRTVPDGTQHFGDWVTRYENRVNELAATSPQLAPALALHYLQVGFCRAWTVTWLLASLEHPVPQHVAILEAAHDLVSPPAFGVNHLEPGNPYPVTSWKSEFSRDLKKAIGSLKEHLKQLGRERQGQVALAETESEAGQVAIASEGEVSLASQSES